MFGDAAVGLLIALGGLTLLLPHESTKALPASVAPQKPYRITMVLYRGCEDACKGFADYFAARKIPVAIEMLDADADADARKLPAFVARVKASKFDFTGAALQRNLPVLASAELTVRDSNALFGVVNRYYTVGQLTALQAERILVHGVAPRDIPIDAPAHFSLIVNMRVAAGMTQYPPMRVLKIAEVVR